MQRARQQRISESVTASTGPRTRPDGEQPRLAVSAGRDDVAPWRYAGPRDQSRLLDWFLSADLSADVNYQFLCVLTARRKPHEWRTEADFQTDLRGSLKDLGWSEAGWEDLLSRPARRRHVMPTGTETGRFGSQRFTSRSRLVAHFRKIQRDAAAHPRAVRQGKRDEERYRSVALESVTECARRDAGRCPLRLRSRG